MLDGLAQHTHTIIEFFDWNTFTGAMRSQHRSRPDDYCLRAHPREPWCLCSEGDGLNGCAGRAAYGLNDCTFGAGLESCIKPENLYLCLKLLD